MMLIDLFSGIGGFTLGLQRAGFEFEHVYYSDKDKYANAVYRKNFPNHTALGDIREIDTSIFPKGKKYIITFGFPCKGMSIAGKREGLNNAESHLFFAALRIVKDLRPETFIFENVKGIFSANKGADFTRVLQEIADIGLYDCEWQLVNTLWLLPQNRERVYFVGHLTGSSFGKVFPIEEDARIRNATEASKEEIHNYCGALKARDYANWGGNFVKVGLYRPHREDVFREMKSGVSPALTARARQDGDGQTVIAVDLKTAGGTSNTRRGGVNEYSPALDHNCYIGVYDKEGKSKNKDYASTLTGGGHSGGNHSDMDIISKDNICFRRLTPIECERLQGFPDDWTKHGHFGGAFFSEEISDTQRYKMCGNTITVDFPEMIGRRLLT